MSVHKESFFEDDVCEHLAANGWLYAKSDAANYDRELALYPSDVVEWVKASQPQAWKALVKAHSEAAGAYLVGRLRKQIDARGVLDVLRHGIEMAELKERLVVAQFRPPTGFNPTIVARYGANRLRVVRQVRFSLAVQDSIDLVLFLNGIPVATTELKTDFTQSVEDAITQYKADRIPNRKGKLPEPLLSFPGGALVHFAVSNSEVFTTTRLDGASTSFLPFNQGNEGGKGNPPSKTGHATAYLWEKVWQRDSWLEILGRYLVARKNAKGAVKSVIFPRYHQLDVTRELVKAVLAEGPGRKYLVQHSAGSGKTNSIAWTAHFLATLHDKADNKVFSSVIVVSDRNVIDHQLQEALADFERTKGVVQTISDASGSKGRQLAEALKAGKQIIVCTIQSFPSALDEARKLMAASGKRFAVLADEAHSSQTGEAAAKLKKVLTDEEVADLEDGGEVSMEDVLASKTDGSPSEAGITYVAFTATPKSKTLQIFGRPANPKKPMGSDNLPVPFHVYTMRQAIEEGFILDVLKNYTSYDVAFRIAHQGRDLDDKMVEKDRAMKSVVNWVKLHEHNIAQKVHVVVEHFRATVAPLLQGQAKAMVVLGSRKEAVRWQLAVNKYIKEKGYAIGALVAFTGEVPDPENFPEPVTEKSKLLNPLLDGRDIRDAFAEDEYSLLLVANKFQTGFDQPLLCGMYVDRRLAGIQAVQTLSRLNRAHPGKDTTYVLDFADNSAEVLKAFQQYYSTAVIEDVTDPNAIFDMKADLDATGYYTEHEIDRVVAVLENPRSRNADLSAAAYPVADRLVKRHKEARDVWFVLKDQKGRKKEESAAHAVMQALEQFRKDLGSFERLYSFLSQIVQYSNPAIESRYRFFRVLQPLLKFEREQGDVDLSGLVLTHHSVSNRGKASLGLTKDAVEPIASPTETASGDVHEKMMAILKEIVDRVNELFEGTTDGDQVIYVNHVLKGKLLESRELAEQARNNTKAQFANSPDLKDQLVEAIIGAMEAHKNMSNQALTSERIKKGLIDILLGPAGLYDDLRRR